MAKAKAKTSNRIVELSSDTKSRKRVLVEFTAAELEAVLDQCNSHFWPPYRLFCAIETLERAQKLIKG